MEYNCTFYPLINTAVLFIAFFLSLIACFCLNTHFMVKVLRVILTVMVGPEILAILCLESEFIGRNKQSVSVPRSTFCRLQLPIGPLRMIVIYQE
jgi:hypothetical protein